MQIIEITTITGYSPYDIILCDITLTYCYTIYTGVAAVPPTLYVNLPPALVGVQSLIVKVVDSAGCEEIQLVTCPPSPTPTPTFTSTPTITPTEANCVCITFTNPTVGKLDYAFTNCDGDYVSFQVDGLTSIQVCGKNPTYESGMIVSFSGYCIGNSCPPPTPTPTPTFTPTKTVTPTHTKTPTQTKTQTRTPSNTPTNTSTFTQTPTNTLTLTPTQTPTNTQTLTPTQSPLDFVVGYFCTYDPDTINVSISTITGGVPAYEVGTTYFASEAAALANGSWLVATSIVYGVPSGVDDTYWLVVKDSVGNILAKSVTTNCVLTPTPTPTVTPTNTPTQSPVF